MSIDETLYELIGATLLACGAAVGVAVDARAIANGDAFVGVLSQRGQWGEINRMAEELKRTPPLKARVGAAEAAAVAVAGRAIVEALMRQPPSAPALRQVQESASSDDRVAAVARLADAVVGPEASPLAAQLSKAVLALVLRDAALLGSLRPAFDDLLASLPASRNVDAPIAPSSQLPAMPSQRELPSPRPVKAPEPNEIGPEALARLEEHLAREGSAPEHRERRLAEMKTWLMTAMASLSRPTNEDARVQALRRSACEALRRGDFEAAHEALRQARRVLREGRRVIEERLREDMLALNAQMAAEAAAIAQTGEMELARRRLRVAAELFAEAAETAPREDRETVAHYYTLQGDALYRLGCDEPDRSALEAAVAAYAAAAGTVGKAHVSAWGAAERRRGQALIAMSEEAEADPSLLAAALDALGGAAATLDPRSDAAEWVAAQLGLAEAHAIAAERTGAQRSIEAAIEHYRAAMSVLDPSASPHDWGLAQMNLGLLLARRSEARAEASSMREALAAVMAGLEAFEQAGLAGPAEQARDILKALYGRQHGARELRRTA